MGWPALHLIQAARPFPRYAHGGPIIEPYKQVDILISTLQKIHFLE